MKILTSFVAFLLVLAAIFVASAVNASEGFANCSSRTFISGFVPGQNRNASQVCRDGVLAISYDGFLRNSQWSAYYVTPNNVADNLPGRLSFYEDPDLQAMNVPQASVKAEVFGDEWNRGHLAPSRIMSWSKDTKRSCYAMSNINPQYYYFNQRTWQALETDVFNWIGGNTALYMVTGAAYDDPSKPRWGPDGEIAIPTYYWKAICDPVSGQSAAFYGYNGEDSAVVVSAKDKKKSAKELLANVGASAKGGAVRLLNKTAGRGQIPRLANGMENFLTVKDLEDHLFGYEIFPASACKTDRVDESFWGWDTSSYGMYNIQKIIDTHPNADKVLKEMYLQHRRDFQKKQEQMKMQ